MSVAAIPDPTMRPEPAIPSTRAPDGTPREEALGPIHEAVIDWYSSNGRDLAFRRTTDPWAILVSEVMAQQTQAARAAEHWTRFMAQFPTPAALAAASPATVIRAWRGLGYNLRAVALRAAAVKIVEEHDGRVPDSLEALVALPGIGPYTARAVLAFAFGRSVAPLDTNIRRVLDRALGPLPVSARGVQATADGFVPPRDAAAWSHALMDLGATICGPREPRCQACPIEAWCRTSTGRSPAAASGPRPPRRAPTPAFPSTTRWLQAGFSIVFGTPPIRRGRPSRGQSASTRWTPSCSRSTDSPATECWSSAVDPDFAVSWPHAERGSEWSFTTCCYMAE